MLKKTKELAAQLDNNTTNITNVNTTVEKVTTNDNQASSEAAYNKDSSYWNGEGRANMAEDTRAMYDARQSAYESGNYHPANGANING